MLLAHMCEPWVSRRRGGIEFDLPGHYRRIAKPPFALGFAFRPPTAYARGLIHSALRAHAELFASEKMLKSSSGVDSQRFRFSEIRTAEPIREHWHWR